MIKIIHYYKNGGILMKVKKMVSFIAAVAMMSSALSCNVSAQDVEDNRYDTEYGMSVRDMYCT